jgi:cellobiose-specific phosphotransferase system component IIC
MDIEDKFFIQIGGIIGITLAYIVAMLIIKRRKRKKD